MLPVGEEIKEAQYESILEWNRSAFRGLLFGVPIALVSLSFYPLIAGALMPFGYRIGRKLQDKYPNVVKPQTNLSGWAIGEWLYGAIIGLSISFKN